MREVSTERLMKDARRVLNNPFWDTDLEAEELYLRLHDDHDGTYTGSIKVIFSRDGDAWIGVEGRVAGELLRFRTEAGGGMSQRVRNALMVLALAIKFDNEERPQETPQETQTETS